MTVGAGPRRKLRGGLVVVASLLVLIFGLLSAYRLLDNWPVPRIETISIRTFRCSTRPYSQPVWLDDHRVLYEDAYKYSIALFDMTTARTRSLDRLSRRLAGAFRSGFAIMDCAAGKFVIGWGFHRRRQGGEFIASLDGTTLRELGDAFVEPVRRGRFLAVCRITPSIRRATSLELVASASGRVVSTIPVPAVARKSIPGGWGPGWLSDAGVFCDIRYGRDGIPNGLVTTPWCFSRGKPSVNPIHLPVRPRSSRDILPGWPPVDPKLAFLVRTQSPIRESLARFMPALRRQDDPNWLLVTGSVANDDYRVIARVTHVSERGLPIAIWSPDKRKILVMSDELNYVVPVE